MTPYIAFVAALSLALVVIRAMIPIAVKVGGLDRPAGHKSHKFPVPYVGGFGAIAAFGLLSFFSILNAGEGELPYFFTLAICGATMFLVGLSDDRWQLSFRIRLAIEAFVVLAMIYGAGVVLTDLGQLLPGVSITLGVFAAPFTVFCIIGVTNALNMIDGVDGLSGSVSLVTLVLLAGLSSIGGNSAGVMLATTLAGGVLGFLYYNFRLGKQRAARVYLGDNGSTLLGFLLGWMFVDFSQGDGAFIAPVTALFLLALPLYDSVMAIVRRIWMGRSPFVPDRSHLHHMLLDAGASVETTVWLLLAFHSTMALIGVAGYLAGVPDALMFALFMGLFLAYGHVISRPWRFIPRIRRAMVRFGVPLEHGSGVFIGRFNHKVLPEVMKHVRASLRPGICVRVFAERRPGHTDESLFIVADLGTWRDVRPSVNQLRRALSGIGAFEIRQFVSRSPEHERRKDVVSAGQERRECERRGITSVRELVEYRIQTPPGPTSVETRPIAA